MQGGMPPMQQNRMPTPGMPPMQQPPPNRMPSMQGGMPPMQQQPMQGGMPPMQGRPGMPMGPGPSQPPRPMQAPPMAPPPQQRPGPGPGRTLVALFEGQQYPVTKEEFIIGRGQKTSDLTIRDSNVSRRHAAVVLYNGQYWIVDQQSTNGIEFNGGKVERKVIEDGDLVRICDHEIQFVYR
ncbi:MAG: FHA domain-containing protein [Polyangiales bacterium]